jgi:hypothetical protein
VLQRLGVVLVLVRRSPATDPGADWLPLPLPLPLLVPPRS